MSNIDYNSILLSYYKKIYEIKQQFPISNIFFHFQTSSLPVIHFTLTNKDFNNIRYADGIDQIYDIEIRSTGEWVQCIEITGNIFNSIKTMYMFQNVLMEDNYRQECIIKIIRKCKLFLNYLVKNKINIRKENLV